MRANEIINKPVTEATSDWFTKQIIGRQQLDKARVQKQNTPKIAKLLQQQIAGEVKKLLTSSDRSLFAAKLKQVVGKLLSNSLKVDLNDKIVQDVIAAINENPDNTISNPQVADALSTAVTQSFKMKQDYTLLNKDVMKRIAQDIASQITKDSNVNEITQAVNDVFGKHDLNAADFVTVSNRNIADAIYAELERRSPSSATEQVLVKQAIVKGSAGTTSSPSASTAAGETTPTGVPIDDLKDGIKDALMAASDEISTNRDLAAEYVQRQLMRNGMKDETKIAELSDEIMQDSDLPFNYNPDSKFRGLVYSPNGTRYRQNSDEDNIAFVKHKGRWTQWVIGPKSTWKYQKPVRLADEKSLESLAKQATDDVIPLSFRQDTTGGMQGMYRVSTK